ncbi:MAG TPA: ABC transporter [Lachnospiraceae bacterium]|nr:ABC transporter [Lachnospiraceae bacterium]HIS63569.1 ABC transporter ATP-binding protein [Candidatus Scybalomonas excrementigallinarum]
MIEVDQLVKSYGAHKAVQNVSFRVEEGQIVGLLGPNGAGKSTTMNVITGYLTPDSGSVRIQGIDIQKNPEKAKRQIGYLPEIPPLYLDMTVQEYLKFVASLKKIPVKEQKKEIDRVTEALFIQEKKTRLIKNLSKGYRQRVGFASALLGNPPVLILDEPTVGLDPNQMIEIRQFIKELGKEHTVILSSHILSEVSAICDHIIIIDKGTVVAQDTPEGLSNAFSGKNQIHMLIDGEIEQVKDVLKRCPLFTSFEAKLSEDGLIDVIGKVGEQEEKEEVRKKLFFYMAKEQLPVYQLSYDNLSLEEVFLKVTREDETEVKEDKIDQEETGRQEEN